jgi:type II secretory pathway pseudopilin PulG
VKKLLSSKDGNTLVELIIAVALFTIISSAVMGSMVTAQKISSSNHENKPKYEAKVGAMDEMLNGDTSAVDGEDVNVTVKFPTGDSVTVASKKIKDDELQNIAIVKKK